jgi:hypothetical protein
MLHLGPISFSAVTLGDGCFRLGAIFAVVALLRRGLSLPGASK